MDRKRRSNVCQISSWLFFVRIATPRSMDTGIDAKSVLLDAGRTPPVNYGESRDEPETSQNS